MADLFSSFLDYSFRPVADNLSRSIVRLFIGSARFLSGAAAVDLSLRHCLLEYLFPDTDSLSFVLGSWRPVVSWWFWAMLQTSTSSFDSVRGDLISEADADNGFA